MFTKIAGAVIKKMEFARDNWRQRVAALMPLFPEEIMKYMIIAAKRPGVGSIEASLIKPENGIPLDIVNDAEANRNPHFMYQTKPLSGVTVHEFTTAVKIGSVWMGVLRIGYSW